ncbi:MAG: hypothetical protein R2852_07090 [Bacteroidia bacterium]
MFWETSLSGVNNYSTDLVVARWNGSAWENKGQSAITVSIPGSVTSNTVTSFSPLTLGSVFRLSILCQNCLGFDGVLNPQNKVDLHWKTASETENFYFVIERSRDGDNFSELLTVESYGNSQSIQSYFCTRSISFLWGFTLMS